MRFRDEVAAFFVEEFFPYFFLLLTLVCMFASMIILIVMAIPIFVSSCIFIAGRRLFRTLRNKEV